MGRRSINTTKSGKYMNPTDQARKEARKKELKKNKKQRQMVRAAVLKNKDPSQILEEMEKIDEMEYDVLQPSPLNEKVLRDKRKKLKETFDRVMRLYHTEDPEHWAELKHKELEYEKNRLKKQQYCESVKHAQSVQIDEIPLPSSNELPNDPIGVPVQISGGKRIPLPPTALSLPPFAPSAPPGTFRKSSENLTKSNDKMVETKRKEPMGVPNGPPPDLLIMQDLDTDAEDEEVVLKKYVPKSKSSKTSLKPNNLQKRILAISGQNIDEFMKEMEHVYKSKEQEPLEKVAGKQKFSDECDTKKSEENTVDNKDTGSKQAPATCDISAEVTPANINLAPTGGQMSVLNTSLPALPALASGMMFRPPIARPPAMHNFGVRMPPGPPPSHNVRHHGVNGMPRLGIRIPGPPPGLPRPLHQQQLKGQHNVQGESKGITTITAKPQIRNLSADVTRFVPSTLRVKREEVRKQVRSKLYISENTNIGTTKTVSKDDAYIQFMNEMQGLL